MRFRPSRFFAAVLMTATSVAALAGSSRAADITGAGSSFAAPIYLAWGDAAKKTIGVNLNYQSIGSSAGQNLVTAGTVDFGASDAPVSGEKLTAASLRQFPTVAGGIVPIINVPGIESDQLKLTGPVLAEIYMGTITNWNDPKIAALNPGLSLPDLPVASIHRADGSGTSFVFTSYLARVSPAWKENVGAATSVQWPDGSGARGNDGVGAAVRATEGGIGYVEYSYARHNHIPTVQLKNHSGFFVSPDSTSFAAAAGSADWTHAANYAVDMLDSAGEKTWPIMSATFVLMPATAKDPVRGVAVRRFFDNAFRTGDTTAKALDYVPMPEAVKQKIEAEYLTK